MKPTTPSLPTAAEALLQIEQWQDLPRSQRRSLASAVNFLCRVMGDRAPMSLRLDPAKCLPAIDGVSTAQVTGLP